MKYGFAAAAIAALFSLTACGQSGQDATAANAHAETVVMDDIQPDDIVLGDENAPVTIIEYASFSCSGCRDFHLNILPELKKSYIDTGKVRLVFREYYKFGAAQSADITRMAGVMARCLTEDKSPEAHSLISKVIFDRLPEWAGRGAIAQPVFIDIGTKVARKSEEEVRACFTREDLDEEAKARVARAEELYGRYRPDLGEVLLPQTPAFVINGKLYGPLSYRGFQGVIDPLLSSGEESGLSPSSE